MGRLWVQFLLKGMNYFLSSFVNLTCKLFDILEMRAKRRLDIRYSVKLKKAHCIGILELHNAMFLIKKPNFEYLYENDNNCGAFLMPGASK